MDGKYVSQIVTQIYTKKQTEASVLSKKNTIINVHVNNNKNQTHEVCGANEVFLRKATQAVNIH